MTELSDYDKRQLGRMLLALDQYDRGIIDISALIANIESLILALETKNTAFIRNLEEHWWQLEAAYASALDQGNMPFGGWDRQSIQPALDELRRTTSTYGTPEDD